MRIFKLIINTILPFILISPCKAAENGMMNDHSHHGIHGHEAISHAPVGVMADHFLKKGEGMVSLRLSLMQMGGNLENRNKISAAEILKLPNIYGMPKNLSIVPNEMDMEMLMLGGMYAPTDFMTLVGMAAYSYKQMNLTSYSPMMPRDEIGSFASRANGLSYISLGALFKISETEKSRWHFDTTYLSSSYKNSKKDVVLNPMREFVDLTLPYGMQVSDNSDRILLGITNVRNLSSNWKMGNQLRGNYKISDDEWSFGNSIELNSWVQFKISPNMSLSTRLNFRKENQISGSNQNIVGPVQTANPRYYGGKVINIGFGANFLTSLFKKKDWIGLEYMYPIYQDKNGVQMETDSQLAIGYMKSFQRF